MNENDLRVYTLSYYDNIGCKHTSIFIAGEFKKLRRFFDNLIDAQTAAEEWAHMYPGGYATIHRCLYNTATSQTRWPFTVNISDPSLLYCLEENNRTWVLFNKKRKSNKNK